MKCSTPLRRRGHVLRAAYSRWAKLRVALTPLFIERGFGPTGNARARQAAPCEDGCSSSDAVTSASHSFPVILILHLRHIFPRSSVINEEQEVMGVTELIPLDS